MTPPDGPSRACAAAGTTPASTSPATAAAPVRRGWRWPRRALSAGLSLLLLLGLGAGILAWRLDTPMPLAALPARLETAAAPVLGGARLTIGGARLGWRGFSGDGDGGPPVVLRLDALRLLDANGRTRGSADRAEASLSLPDLLRGRIVPASIELRGLALSLERDREGTLGLGLGEPSADAAADTPGLRALLEDLVPPVGGAAQPGVLGKLRSLRLSGGRIAWVEAGRTLAALTGVEVDLRRTGSGAMAGGGTAALGLGGIAAPVRLRWEPADGAVRLTLDVAALRPAELGGLDAGLAPLGTVDTVLSGRWEASVGTDARLGPWRIEAAAGPGGVALAEGRLPFGGLVLRAEGDATNARLHEARLRLGAATLALSGSAALAGTWRGDAARADGAASWRGDAAVALQGPLDLFAAWPEGLAADLRARVLAVLPALVLDGGEARLSATRDPDGRVHALTGAARLSAARIGLDPGTAGGPPAPPGTNGVVSGSAVVAVTFGPDELAVTEAALQLPPARPGGPAPSLTATGSARRAGEGWHAEAALGLGALSFADLPAHWPEALRRNERAWITGNVTAGEIRSGRVGLRAVMDAAGSVEITNVTGTLEAEGVTIHWLRPIPPVVGVAATAELSEDEIAIRTRGGRQLPAEGGRAGLEAREGLIRFHGLSTEPGQADIRVTVAGALPEALAVVRHPRLKLFERRPLPVQATGGTATTRIAIAFPLWDRLPIDELRIRVESRIEGGRLADLIGEHDLSRGNLDLVADTDGMRLGGTAQLAELPVRLDVGLDFRAGPPAQITERATVTARATPPALRSLGLDLGRDALAGAIALEARGERRRDGATTVALRGDLREARIALPPLGWEKRAGAAGSLSASLRLNDAGLLAIEGARADAPGLTLRGRAGFGPGSRIERIELAEAAIGNTRLVAEARRGREEDAPLSATLRGGTLDLGPLLAKEERPASPATSAATSAGPPRRLPPLVLDARFDRLLLGPRRSLGGVEGAVRTDAAGVLRQAQVRGDGFAVSVEPDGAARRVRATADDFGLLLRSAGVDGLDGGRLGLDASYPDTRPGAALSGTATLDGFALRSAPAAARVLQALTVYGIAEALQGGDGLVVSRAIVPFTLTPTTLALHDARAYSASLGITVGGEIRRDRDTIDVGGTIVPAYLVNTALGNLPLVGRLFSPERGGGVFAATFRARGPIGEPSVSINPLAALAPGLLRRLFGAPERAAEEGR